MVDLRDRQTQLRIAAVVLAIIIIMFFLGLPPFGGSNSSPPESPDNNTTSMPPSGPATGFPPGASESGINPDTLLETHRETLRNSDSLTYRYTYITETEGNRTIKRIKAQLNTEAQRYLITTESNNSGTIQYRTDEASYETPILNKDPRQINPTPAVPSTAGTAETNEFGFQSFKERLTRENASFEYQGMTMFYGERVHAYSTENVAGPTPEFFRSSGSFTLYVHPDGYIMGLDGQYQGSVPSPNEDYQSTTYDHTELVYAVNDTSVVKPDWVPE